MLLSSTNKKITIKKALKWIFSEFSISFVAILFFMTVHDTMTGQSSNTSEYCAKYGFLASPECWK
jgi:hypothetical protein